MQKLPAFVLHEFSLFAVVFLMLDNLDKAYIVHSQVQVSVLMFTVFINLTFNVFHGRGGVCF